MHFTHPIFAAIAVKFGLNLQETEEFVAGILYGFVKQDDLAEIQKCLTNGERLESEIEGIVADFS